MNLDHPARHHGMREVDLRVGHDGDDVGRRGYVVAELSAWGRGAGDVSAEAASGCAGHGGEKGVSGAAGSE